MYLLLMKALEVQKQILLFSLHLIFSSPRSPAVYFIPGEPRPHLPRPPPLEMARRNWGRRGLGRWSSRAQASGAWTVDAVCMGAGGGCGVRAALLGRVRPKRSFSICFLYLCVLHLFIARSTSLFSVLVRMLLFSLYAAAAVLEL